MDPSPPTHTSRSLLSALQRSFPDHTTSQIYRIAMLTDFDLANATKVLQHERTSLTSLDAQQTELYYTLEYEFPSLSITELLQGCRDAGWVKGRARVVLREWEGKIANGEENAGGGGGAGDGQATPASARSLGERITTPSRGEGRSQNRRSRKKPTTNPDSPAATSPAPPASHSPAPPRPANPTPNAASRQPATKVPITPTPTNVRKINTPATTPSKLHESITPGSNPATTSFKLHEAATSPAIDTLTGPNVAADFSDKLIPHFEALHANLCAYTSSLLTTASTEAARLRAKITVLEGDLVNVRQEAQKNAQKKQKEEQTKLGMDAAAMKELEELREMKEIVIFLGKRERERRRKGEATGEEEEMGSLRGLAEAVMYLVGDEEGGFEEGEVYEGKEVDDGMEAYSEGEEDL